VFGAKDDEGVDGIGPLARFADPQSVHVEVWMTAGQSQARGVPVEPQIGEPY
jgi:hypothetical protein